MGLQIQAMVKITQRVCAEHDKRLRTEPGQRLMCVCCGGSGWGTREEELLQIHKALCRGSQESGIWDTKEQIPRATY